MERVNVLIAGGGVIGSALAFWLAKRGVRDIQVVDLDLTGIYASSELNAGGARATWWQPVNIETCRMTLDFFRSQRELFGFRESGYLWLYDDPELFAVARTKQHLQRAAGLEVELLSPEVVAENFPIIDRNLEELVGLPPEADLGDRIDEPGLLRRVDRLRAVETRAQTELDASRFQLGDGPAQLGDGIAQVRPQSDVAVHSRNYTLSPVPAGRRGCVNIPRNLR